VGALTAGAVVLIPFPFSDLSQAKLRPAVVLADAERGDFILCQITSNPYADPLAIGISASDFTQGSLNTTSDARPGKLFTASKSLVVRQVAELAPATHTRIIDAVVKLIRGPGAT
jgi:mRNA interferase MazF